MKKKVLELTSNHPICFSEYQKGYIFPYCKINNIKFEKIFFEDETLIKAEIKQKSEKKLELTMTSDQEISENVETRIKNYINQIFDIDSDYGPALNRLREIAEEINILPPYGIGFLASHSADEMLLNALLSQNTTAKFYFKMEDNLAEMFGQKFESNEFSHYSYPSLKELSLQKVEKLAECKIGYRIKTIPLLVDFLVKNPDNELKKIPSRIVFDNLKNIKGIGDYSAGCFLIYFLKRYDTVFIDSWVRYIMNKAFGLPKKVSLKQLTDYCNDNFGTQPALVLDYLLGNIK